MAEWWEKSGEASKAFAKAREVIENPVPGGNPKFLTHSDEDLENWRSALEDQRNSPDHEQHLTIGGASEREVHERNARDLERQISEIEAEQLHRLHLELDRQAEDRERDDDEHQR